MSDEGSNIVVSPSEHIVIMVDPYTKEHFVFNHTMFKDVEMDGCVDVGKNSDGDHIMTLSAKFIMKGKK